MLKLTFRTIPVLVVLLLAGASGARAQGVSAYFGVGSFFDSSATEAGCSSGEIVDPFVGTCTPVNSMGGAFGVFGADFMIKPHIGVNGEYAFRFAQDSYMPSEQLNIRPAFYDFNLVYQPGPTDSRVVPVLEAGIGGAKMSYYIAQSLGNLTTQSQFFTSSNHFQAHVGAGVKIYVKGDIFVKPQFDFHWVHNLTDQYGRSTVPGFTVSVGYTFGRT